MKRKFLNILLCLFLMLSLSMTAMAATLDTAQVSVNNTPEDKTVVTISGDDTVLKALDEQDKTARIAVDTDFEDNSSVHVLLLNEADGEIMDHTWVTKEDTAMVQFTVPQAGTYEIRLGDLQEIDLEPTVELAQTSFVYDGTAKTPAVTVKNGNTVIPSTEYSVTYANNINAGTASVTITDRDGGRYAIVQKQITFPIQARQLSWNISGLTASKKAGDSAEATVYGTLTLSGILNNEITFTHGTLITSGFNATAAGSYSAQVVPEEGSWDFPTSSNYLYPTANPLITATVNPVQQVPEAPEFDQAPEDDIDLKLEMESGLSQVPEELEQTYPTPEVLEEAMTQTVLTENAQIKEENVKVYDVTLLVSLDDGKTWQAADEHHWPDNGKLTVTLPYPQGTDSTFRFTVVHMFTSDAFGKTPGDTETPTVTNTRNGIRFVVTGLSPISVGWQEITPSVKIAKTENGKVTTSAASAKPGTTITIQAKPDSGYQLSKIKVKDAEGAELKLTDLGSGKFSFQMPQTDVTVTAKFSRKWVTWDDNPETGDQILTALMTMVISTVMLSTIFIFRKKRT